MLRRRVAACAAFFDHGQTAVRLDERLHADQVHDAAAA
jgi:hypothetical protein